MDLACFIRDLETERSLKVYSLGKTINPIEREFVEREIGLLDAQISWVEEALTRKIA